MYNVYSEHLFTAAIVLGALVLAASLGLVLPGAAVVAPVAGPVGGYAERTLAPTVELCLAVAASCRNIKP